MVDNVITIFEMQNESSMVTNDALLLSGCHAILFPEKLVRFDMDELNLLLINSEESSFGYLIVEFCFENNLKAPFNEFYSAFFSIRTDNGVTIKINSNPNVKTCSKMSRDNKLVLAISYYFKSEMERDEITKCNLFCIEGFVSFRTKTDINGIMCRLIKKRK